MDYDRYERQSSVETNTLYMMALATDLILRDNARRMERLNAMMRQRGGMRHETKMRYTEYVKAVKRACTLNEQITQDIYDVEKKFNYQNVDIWLSEANELARFVLSIADKSTEPDAREKIYAYINSFKGEGLIDQDFLKPFYLK